MNNVPLICKNCGSDTFKTIGKPKSLSDLDGAVCSKCGTAFSKRDAEIQVKKLGRDLVRNAIRKAGFK